MDEGTPGEVRDYHPDAIIDFENTSIDPEGIIDTLWWDMGYKGIMASVVKADTGNVFTCTEYANTDSSDTFLCGQCSDINTDRICWNDDSPVPSPRHKFEQPGDFLGATAKPFKSMYTRAEQYYTAADDFWKVVAYGSELRAIKSQFKTEADLTQLLAHAKDLGMSYTINRQDLETAQRELAAFKVRQTIPNYDYVGRFAETLRTGPLAFLGNF